MSRHFRVARQVADSFCLKISGERVIYNPLYFSPICGYLRHSRGIIYSTCKVAGVILLSFHRCCVKFVKHSEMFQIRRWSWLTQLEGDMLSLRYFYTSLFWLTIELVILSYTNNLNAELSQLPGEWNPRHEKPQRIRDISADVLIPIEDFRTLYSAMLTANPGGTWGGRESCL